MTQLEIEIKVLEGQLDVINQTIVNLNDIVPDSIKQQKQSLENELVQKRLQLNAQNNETV